MGNSCEIPENAHEGKVMNVGLFECFCEMLDSIPAKAVLRAVDAERRMVEDDLEKKRTERDEYVNSVLAFCNFLTQAVRGLQANIPKWPFEHCVVYRTVLERLVDAGELPSEIINNFEENVSRARKCPP